MRVSDIRKRRQPGTYRLAQGDRHWQLKPRPDTQSCTQIFYPSPIAYKRGRKAFHPIKPAPIFTYTERYASGDIARLKEWMDSHFNSLKHPHAASTPL